MAPEVLLILALASLGAGQHPYDYRSSSGLFPSVFNIAEGASIYSNTTCGAAEPEIYCKLLSETSSARQCGVCDVSRDDKHHPIEFAIDGKDDTWWQASSLQTGMDSNYATITLDLKEVFQVAYVLITTGISPRPGNWLLERSIDGQIWGPWQFFADSDEECWTAFGVEPRKDKPSYASDAEVICTSYYSKLEPLENAQIHVSLVNGRPGASGPSRTLVDFTQARYIRMRFLKLQLLPTDSYLLSGFNTIRADDSIATQARRYFYSIKDITIGGQCPCNGHANECPVDHSTMRYECKCKHNTCGPLCNQCCPMYNQKRWRPGKFISGNYCERCQCFNHADECYFDPQVEAERKSLNTDGKYEGGGVCIHCRDETVGINCESCREGFYRPKDVSQFDTKPCRRCDCDPMDNPGSTGSCYPNQDPLALKEAGDCRCKKGYSGPKCNECDRGYHGYPNCIPCTCSLAGTKNGACTGTCECKDNVVGSHCDRCKPGYFALHESNSKGCMRCFCYGVTNECEAASLGVEVLQEGEGWKVTDLRRSVVVDPYWSTVTNGVTVAEEDMQGIQIYFWDAPLQYIGNRLVSYGQEIRIRTSWHTARGDTAGSPIRAPEIILEGENMMIAYGTTRYRNRNNATIHVNLVEDGWYHIPDNLKQIQDSGSDQDIPDFVGLPVSKVEFMKVLGSMKRMLFRSKYHTDQLEGTLHTAEMEFGSERSVSLKKTLAVERCACPLGYEGLSCEKCSYGYTRYNETLYEGICKKCNCNGHAASCDPYSLKCAECQHNTIGDECERCIDGFYGNPLSGTPADCKPCKCPLDISSNNFSPTCQEVSSMDYDKYSLAPNEYVCNACPRGYAGPHCERCDNGYFGNPLSVGNVCKPCDCNGNSNPYAPDWCDHRTGQCLICMGNTSGWKCDNCLPGFYGNALAGRCLPCDCNPFGSSSSDCHPTTGQCTCREKKYLGRTCSKCKDGFGNLRAGCRQCNCNPTGSVSDFCEADTGQCHCRPGIMGLVCDKCLPFYFGFSVDGCQPCNCHPTGSIDEQCDPFNGQCRCKDNVHGSQCEKCMKNHWNIDSKTGCSQCRCDLMGSHHNDCDDSNGQCACKPGVGGTLCDACIVGFWGFSPSGCKKCYPCDKPGHVCDPDTGRCICPPLTQGQTCSECSLGTWNYHPYKGCQYCKCHSKGSLSNKCDLLNGQCKCMTGFEGQLCDRCSPGYYNFPNCKPCNCNPAGTASGECFDDGLCKCNEDGTCLCKKNVEGKKCASCKLGTFGLSLENPIGCTNCFCFGRTQSCKQSNYFWTQLAFPEGRTLSITRGSSPLNVTHGLTLIPFQVNDVSIGILGPYREPLYWDLPDQFRRDKITSYNGYLRFTIQSDGEADFDSAISFPLVQIQGPNTLIIDHFQSKLSSSGRYEVRLLEKEWILKSNGRPVSRETLMVILQNIQRVLVRGTDKVKATKIQLKGVTLDAGKPLLDQGRSLRLALGVEQCECPKEYSSSSCQNPGKGYYRHYDDINEEISTSFVNYVGKSRHCLCNGRTNDCAPESGLCLNCRENTAGPHCNICAPGFYGSPNHSRGCQPCKCPSARRNFATTCSVNDKAVFSCECQRGYTGPKCETCDYGYYGNPQSEGGKCVPCNCNKLGSLSDQCNSNTGACTCASPEIVGRDCSQCQPRHILSKKRQCKNCEDGGCTSYLLDFVQLMENALWDANVTELDPAPNIRLTSIKRRTANWEDEINAALRNKNRMIQIQKIGFGTEPQSEIIQLEVGRNLKMAKSLAYEAENLFTDANNVEDDLSRTQNGLIRIIDRLKSYSVGGIGSEASVNAALSEARKWVEEMKTHDFGEIDIKARTELSHARILNENMKKMIYGTSEIPRLREELHRGEHKMNDLLKYIDHGLAQSRFTSSKNRENNRTLYQVLDLFTQTMLLNEKGSKVLSTSFDTYQDGREALNDAWDVLSALPDQYDVLFGSVGKNLENEEIGLSGLVEDYRQRYIQPCEKKGIYLQQLARELANLLQNSVGHHVEQTLRAVNVYGNIVSSVENAQKAAQSAVKKAKLAVNKANGDRPLKNRAEEVRIKSKDILQEAEGLQKNSMDLKSFLSELTKKWAFYKEEIILNFSKLETLVPEIKRFTMIVGPFKNTEHFATNALNEAESMINKILETQSQIQIQLRNVAEELQSFIPGELENIPHKITESSRTMYNVDKQATYLERRNIDIVNADSLVMKNLDLLIDKVGLGNQLASTIRMSITNESPESNCIRSFEANLYPSVSNTISIIFGTDDPNETSGLLVYLASGKQSSSIEKRDFIAIEMVDRKIRFLWNNGHGTAVITHNVTIEAAQSLSTDDHAWYRITAERIGHIGRLNVRKVRPIYDIPDFHRWVVGESPPEANVFDVLPSDLIYIGGFPEALQSSDLKSNGRLAGAIYDLSFDGNNIGLWNFVQTSGCKATHSGIMHSSIQLHSCYVFDGRGSYAIQSNLKAFDPRYLSISLEFMAYDSDSMIFFSFKSENEQFLALELKNGRIHFVIHYGNNKKLKFLSNKSYNGGTWVKVEMARAVRNSVETGVLRIVHNGIGEDLMNTLPDVSFDMSNSTMYFGGFPPDASIKDFVKKHGLNFKDHYAGHLRGITLSNPGYNTMINPLFTATELPNTFYGVEADCNPKTHTSVMLEGNGYLELKSQPLRRDSSFGLTFETQDSESLLIVSTFLGQSSKGSEDNFFSVSLMGGKLVLLFGSEDDVSSPRTFMSENRYNDGEVHTLVAIKRGRRVSIYVDDGPISGPDGVYLSVNEIPAPITGGLFVGGLPGHLRSKASHMVKSVASFKGLLKDVVFIDDLSVRVVSMTNPVSFSNAGIGRDKVFERVDSFVSLSSSSSFISSASLTQSLLQESLQMQDQETSIRNDHQSFDSSLCSDVHEGSLLEDDAFGFGGVEGFVRKSSTLHSPKRLEVSLEFRSSGSNGVLFAFKLRKQGENQKHIIVYLNDDVLNCALLGLTTGALTLQKSLQDVKTPLSWSHVGMKYRIESAVHILELYVNKERVQKIQFAHNRPLTPFAKTIYFGRAPKAVEKLSPKLYSPFVGCLKEIFVNSNMDSFRYNRKSSKPTLPCYRELGVGSYFVSNGSHAAYDFPAISPSPSVYLTISLAFKTPHLKDMVLFSIIQLETGTPGVTVSLIQGKLDVRLGTESFRSSKSNCPNVWHKIEISVTIDKRVQLKVDGVSDVSQDIDQVLSYNFTEIIFGALSGRASFSGCLRNVFLNGKPLSSLNLRKSGGVVPDGCSI